MRLLIASAFGYGGVPYKDEGQQACKLSSCSVGIYKLIPFGDDHRLSEFVVCKDYFFL